MRERHGPIGARKVAGIGALVLSVCAGCAATDSGPAASRGAASTSAATATPKIPAPRISLPLKRAWVDGRQVEYITTDASDADVAREEGANYAPRLRNALPVPGGRSALERVYVFVDGSQPTVFQSAPKPTGADNRDTGYSPLWRMVKVSWLRNGMHALYRDEESILAGADRGELVIDVTGVVVNCPIIRSVDGQALRDALPR